MRKITIIILFLGFVNYVFSQNKDLPKHSEYWYASFKLSLLNNVSVPFTDNQLVFVNSPYGHLPASYKPFTYTPGGNFGFYYNFDFKNNINGIVIGIEAQNVGFSNRYGVDNENFKYKVTNQFRATVVNVPVYLKFWNSDIYKKQTYMYAGFVYQKYLNVYNIQSSSWNSVLYMHELSDAEKSRGSWQGLVGFNTDIYFVAVRYSLTNMLNKDYQFVSATEGTLRPYADISFINTLYLEAGFNIPLTRWLTTKYWTAEKIRRFFKPKR